MTPEESFEKMKPRYDALDKEAVRRPTQGPVNTLCDEYNRLAKVAEGDVAKFEKLAKSELFDIEDVLMLSCAAHGLSYAEARWVAFSNPGQSPELGEKLARIKKIRSTQIMDLDFVERRHNPEGLAKTLTGIREGSSRSDTLADVLALSQLAGRYETLLQGIGHDPAIDKEGSALCTELRDYVDADKEKMAHIKEMRDRAFTAASAMYDEVRSGGQFIFRGDEDKLDEYRNQTGR